MLALHFGAGNIGRGFIGSLLYQSGYKTCFVDVNKEIVDLINDRKEYRIVLAEKSREELIVKDVEAINSQLDPEKVIEAIVHADLVTTAVGPSILPLISGLIAEGLKKRLTKNRKSLNIIACENMVGGSTFLEEKVYEKISDDEKEAFKQYFAFPNAAVDRIVPNQSNEDKLMVMVEPFFEWVVDETQMIGERPEITGITYVKGLNPYIERKLFTMNTGHTTAAYLGYYSGIDTINETMKIAAIRDLVENTINETGELLIKKYQFDREVHSNYIKKIMERFSNPFIIDEVTRVGRSPLRKLGPNDRFLSPAKQFVEMVGEEPIFLAKGIAATLLYDHTNDEEAMELQATIKQEGIEAAIEKYTKLSKDSTLVNLIVKQYYTLKDNKY
ncbi:mannitol-1-phosphate 5-dehydrogenase [Anaerobacillus alkalidiazotrophicus]|uniref:Mannitol-1-phosphate 5-dehydrogenase n=1 Tax=Anaerobacillus alkalidiazotrophicus TaxID=472963 RepID=A0A1S2M2E1_9BACI|nr:mannitol-1-phosphate 5-dehydrogenase [Anaerobacillus alkalidiazotrophicus]OIJ18087.1 mannitol-1-phosphate 5-dehydrogenase [Anaerobacillus alkalidiazotrophicus]OIJ19566.1 mannitol-1-phosphate 5-dehydrogenase [Anaerobacillus alkalidiazotrophicus]